MSNENLLEQLESYQATRTINRIFNEAADEIRRLTEEIGQLRAQLKRVNDLACPPLMFDEAALAKMKKHEEHYRKQWSDRMKEVTNVYNNG
jgi:hypothetical protein